MEERIDNPDDLRRAFPLKFALNKLELAAFNKYCTKYNITNRSKFIREILMREVIQRLESDYPKLFSEQEMSGKNIQKEFKNT